MTSYQRYGIPGFWYHEWGPDAVENFILADEDRVKNLTVWITFIVVLITILSIWGWF